MKEKGRRAANVLEKRSQQLEASVTENTGVATKKNVPDFNVTKQRRREICYS